MKRLFATIIALLFIGGIIFFYLMPPKQELFETTSPYRIDSCTKDRKKILIFSSQGGGGHVSATNAIHQYLSDEYCVGDVFMYSQVLKKFDLMQTVSQKKVCFEDFHNWLAKKKLFQLINLEVSVGLWFLKFNQKGMEQAIEKYLLKHRPNLIISVIPYFNHMINNVAQKLDIPFLYITTDLDPTTGLYKMDNVSYDNFYLGISFKTPEILEKIKDKHVNERFVHEIGFPVKREFWLPKDQKAVKKELGIPNNKPVILLMMGALGTNDLYRFSRELSTLSIPAHVVIITGKSTHMKSQLEKIPFPKHVTRTILGFTNKVPELMGIADLLITKSGAATINEAVYSKLPMLIDVTAGTIAWEKLNSEFVVNNGLGNVISKYYLIAPMVTEFLQNKQKIDQIKKNFAKFSDKNPEQELKLLVKKILTKR